MPLGGGYEVKAVERVKWDSDTAWRRFCGFLEFSRDAALDVQRRLLRDQIRLVKDSPVGQRFLSAMQHDTVDEFRSRVPLTTYSDYADLLQPDAPARMSSSGYMWTYTATGPRHDKWVPYTPRGYERLLDNVMAALILAAAEWPGRVAVHPGDVVMYNVPPRPYLSGLAAFGMRERFGFTGVLDPVTSEALDFKARVTAGFEQALRGRVDIIISLTSILNKVSARFEHGAAQGTRNRSGMHLNARAMYRLARARIKSALAGRPIRPKDLWNAKAIVGWGLDTDLFSGRIERCWGKQPYQMYAATEGGVMGMQAWDGHGMVFSPYSDFYEFVPVEESRKWRDDPSHRPDALQLDEVEQGKTYEVVITNFYGMPLVRYRLGHLVQILAQGVNGPEFEFVGRSDDLIDIAGFTRINEKTVWKALDGTGIPPSEWTVRREPVGDKLTLHLYAEPHVPCDEAALAARLHANLKRADPLYADLEDMLGIRPLRVTVLPPGTFDRYYEAMRQAGEPLTRRQPPRMNANDDVIDGLLAAADHALDIAA